MARVTAARCVSSRPARVGARNHPFIRRLLLVAALVATASGDADAQSVCDRLFPFGLVSPEGGFESGCAHVYVLRQGSSSASSANFTPLAYPECPNGPCAGQTGPLQFVCATANGYFCCLSAADLIPIVAGNMMGPLLAGLNQRMANDTDQRPGICFSEYAGNGSRLGEVPLTLPIGNGVAVARISGFVRIFVTAPVLGSGTVYVEFLGEPTPARGASWGRTKFRYR